MEANVSDKFLDFDGLEMGLNEVYARLTCRVNLNLPEVVWVCQVHSAHTIRE